MLLSSSLKNAILPADHECEEDCCASPGNRGQPDKFVVPGAGKPFQLVT